MMRASFSPCVGSFLILLWGSALRAADAAVDDPFGLAKPAPAAAAPPAAAIEKPAVAPEEKDPIVLAVRGLNPSRPSDLIWAARTVLDGGRGDEARRYLKQLLDRMPDAKALAALHREFGSGLFVRFVRDDRVQPEGREVARAVLDAASQAARDPARLETVINRLADPDPLVRRLALEDLREAGHDGAAALITVVADKDRASLHEAARDALGALGLSAQEPLLAALQAPDDNVRFHVVTALGLAEDRAAVPYLLHPLLGDDTPDDIRQAAEKALLRIVGAVPTRSEAERYLRGQIERRLAGQQRAWSDEEGTRVVWMWDDKQRTVVSHEMTGDAAARWSAALLARELHRLLPDSREVDRLYLTLLLDWARSDAGEAATQLTSPRTPREVAQAAGVATLAEVVAFASEQYREPAAIAALDILREIGDARLLAGAAGQPGTVARALRHGDPGVRFAAAAAIMQWDPSTSYPGSSHLIETLAYFIKTAGVRRVLVGHPRTETAQTIVGMLNELGFEADTAPTGREVFRLATENPDYELMLVSDALDSPPAKELIQQLRHDARSARLPVGILTREVNLADMQRFAEDDALTDAFPRAHDVTGVMWQVRRLLEMPAAARTTPEQRQQWAEAGLEYYGRVASRQQHYLFPEVLAQEATLIEALFVGGLSAPAAHVLGLLGSPAAQRSLVTLAGQHERSLSARQAAATAFALAVARRGLLLSRAEILLQYDVYNRSAALDRETQQLLGSILDAIEAPTLARQ